MESTEFPCGSFYGGNSAIRSGIGRSGSANELRSRIVERTEVAEKFPPVPLPFEPGLTGVSRDVKSFRRLVDAIDFWQKRNSDGDLMIFAYEHRTLPVGHRLFCVTTPQRIWWHYLSSKNRNLYEVILDGIPCRMYFDVEFYFAFNPDANGFAIVQKFARFVCKNLEEIFGIFGCNYEKNVVDLDSTTETKFSRHLIFHLPEEKIFASGVEIGKFVRKISSNLRSMTESERVANDVADLFLLNKDGEKVLICDEAVYSRNRNFRMFLSTKFGQNAPLILAKECKFYQSHLTNEQNCSNIPSKQNRKRRRMSKNDENENLMEKIFYDSLLTFSKIPPNSSQILPPIEVEAKLNAKGSKRTGGTASSSAILADSSNLGNRNGSSPFPDLDKFLLDFLRKFKSDVAIRQWRMLGKFECVVYDIDRYRFCQRIDREHKSNHVYFVADLKRYVLYQKCFDPDCHEFRGDEIPLPKAVIDSVRERLEDFELVQAAEVAETVLLASAAGSNEV